MADPPAEVKLRDPAFAAFLAWLIPGAGHVYQGRFAKGALLAVCILSTFFYGLFLGDGRVVYAAWNADQKRLPYLCQLGAGLVAMPALVQARRVAADHEPFFGGWYAPPKDKHALDAIHKRLHRFFELGTVYTMVAGLLNVLAIYDAFGGPAYIRDEEDEEQAQSRGQPDEDKHKPAPV
ncbi:MAG: hypothetical protein K1X74_14265 [Pirellulales bacterium]|nr:hypothetical protein [Pirellulales bacterium]